jgi:hypothetical protein
MQLKKDMKIISMVKTQSVNWYILALIINYKMSTVDVDLNQCFSG